MRFVRVTAEDRLISGDNDEVERGVHPVRRSLAVPIREGTANRNLHKADTRGTAEMEEVTESRSADQVRK